MLRSMFIGLAIAALLQVGMFALTPAGGSSFGAKRLDWVQVQTVAVGRLFDASLTRLVH
jgi:hypothetical protein